MSLCFLHTLLFLMQRKCDIQIQCVTPVPSGGLSLALIRGPVHGAAGGDVGPLLKSVVYTSSAFVMSVMG